MIFSTKNLISRSYLFLVDFSQPFLLVLACLRLGHLQLQKQAVLCLLIAVGRGLGGGAAHIQTSELRLLLLLLLLLLLMKWLIMRWWLRLPLGLI